MEVSRRPSFLERFALAIRSPANGGWKILGQKGKSVKTDENRLEPIKTQKYKSVETPFGGPTSDFCPLFAGPFSSSRSSSSSSSNSSSSSRSGSSNSNSSSSSSSSSGSSSSRLRAKHQRGVLPVAGTDVQHLREGGEGTADWDTVGSNRSIENCTVEGNPLL